MEKNKTIGELQCPANLIKCWGLPELRISASLGKISRFRRILHTGVIPMANCSQVLASKPADTEFVMQSPGTSLCFVASTSIRKCLWNTTKPYGEITHWQSAEDRSSCNQEITQGHGSTSGDIRKFHMSTHWQGKSSVHWIRKSHMSKPRKRKRRWRIFSEPADMPGKSSGHSIRNHGESQ